MGKIMRKIQVFWLVLVAMCAFSAFASSQAFALTFELAQWLANGALIAEALLSDAVGSLFFEDLLTGAHFLCSGLFEGTVGPDSADEVTMVYDLTGRLIEELDETTATAGLVCTENLNLCSKVEIWPVKLPWLTEVELDIETGLFYELTTGAAYNLLCEVLGMDKVELCEAVTGTSGELLNVTGGVEVMGVAEPESTCNGVAEMGLVEADPGNLITLTNGEPLTVSE